MNRSLTTLALLALIATPALAAEKLTNGNFESQPNFGAGLSHDSGYTLVVGNDIPGWTIEPNHGATIHNTVLYPTISGSYSINLDGEGLNGLNANLYQDFTSSLFESYALSYQYDGWQFSTAQLFVTVTDLTTNAVLFSKTSPWDANLITESGSFLGTGNTLRLRVFETTTGFNDNAFMVDNFSVQSTAIPEPATLALPALLIPLTTRLTTRRRR